MVNSKRQKFFARIGMLALVAFLALPLTAFAQDNGRARDGQDDRNGAQRRRDRNQDGDEARGRDRNRDNDEARRQEEAQRQEEIRRQEEVRRQQDRNGNNDDWRRQQDERNRAEELRRQQEQNRNEEWRRRQGNNDDWRRQQERQRAEEWRRQEAERIRAEEWRRQPERNRNNDDWRRNDDNYDRNDPVTLRTLSTMADGIAVARPGDVPFGVISSLGVEVITVTEEQISRALLLLVERVKMVVEPAGAASVAALLDPEQAREHGLRPPVVAVLSGGNLDPLLLLRVIEHGMAAAGRYLELRLRLPDRPGSLAGLLGVLAGTDANVLEVQHGRASPGTVVGEAEVALRLETQGAQHRERVLAELTAAGYLRISP